MEMRDDGNTYFNDGNNGGLVIVGDLVSRLNKLENGLNTLRSNFNGHTHLSPPAPVNPVTTATPLPVDAGNNTLTKNSDIENQKVQH